MPTLVYWEEYTLGIHASLLPGYTPSSRVYPAPSITAGQRCIGVQRVVKSRGAQGGRNPWVERDIPAQVFKV